MVNVFYGYINYDFLLVVFLRLKIWLINNVSVYIFVLYVIIGYNIVLFCLILYMIKFYYFIDIIFNIFFMYNNMKIKLYNIIRVCE